MPGWVHEDVKKIINDEILNTLNDQFEIYYSINEHEFPPELLTEVCHIIKSVKKKKIDRDAAVIQLLSLKSKSTPLEFRIIKSIKYTLKSLPREIHNEEPKEMELITRYIHSFLVPLFDDPDMDILFRWGDEINLEAGKITLSISRCRPDSSVTKVNGFKLDYNLGFGEIKSRHEVNNNAALSKDLVKLGVFSKNSIDIDSMNAVLTFQTIGRHITFYITKLMEEELYVMYELKNIKIPGSIEELLSYTMHLGDTLDVLNIFNTHYYRSSTEEQEEMRKKIRQTYSIPAYMKPTNKTTSNKRQCVTKRHL
ncbi:unnamed protein product [Cunninghamella echinulata]